MSKVMAAMLRAHTRMRVAGVRAGDMMLARDFCTLAVSEGGIERNDGVAMRHPSTGVLTLEYPLSWLGTREYMASEIGMDRLPPRLRAAGPRGRVRVLHTPDQVCKTLLIQSSYGAPCVEAEHPERVHVRYAPGPMVGMLGTSHRMVETALGTLPVVLAAVHVARTQDEIMVRGKLGSSLCYAFRPVWAEEAGDMQCGDRLFRAVDDYDILHDMGIVNHMVIACAVDESRGNVAARVVGTPAGRLIF